jgi:hypothetical protein
VEVEERPGLRMGHSYVFDLQTGQGIALEGHVVRRAGDSGDEVDQSALGAKLQPTRFKERASAAQAAANESRWEMHDYSVSMYLLHSGSRPEIFTYPADGAKQASPIKALT